MPSSVSVTVKLLTKNVEPCHALKTIFNLCICIINLLLKQYSIRVSNQTPLYTVSIEFLLMIYLLLL